MPPFEQERRDLQAILESADKAATSVEQSHKRLLISILRERLENESEGIVGELLDLGILAIAKARPDNQTLQNVKGTLSQERDTRRLKEQEMRASLEEAILRIEKFEFRQVSEIFLALATGKDLTTVFDMIFKTPLTAAALGYRVVRPSPSNPNQKPD